MATYNEDIIFSSAGKNVGNAAAPPNGRFNTLTVDSTQTLTGNTTMSGNATVAGTLAVTGAQTLTGNTTMSGNATVGGTLAVTGASTLTGNATCGGTLAVTGTSAFTGAIAANGGVTGAHDGTVGATTPNTGAFTTLTSTAITSQTVKAGGLLSGNYTAVTANTNTTNAQDLMTYSLAAGSLNSAGRTLKLFCAGNYTTQSAQTPTITFGIVLGAVTLFSVTTAATTASQATLPWYLDVKITCASTGASGTLEVHGLCSYRLGTGAGTLSVSGDANTGASSALDLTSGLVLKTQGTFSTNAATANIFVQRQMVVEWLNI